MPMAVRIATRGSVLALRQAELVADRLRDAQPGLAIEFVVASTAGDRDKRSPLTALGQGVFVKGVEQMVLSGAADLAVHSLKDVPIAVTPGLVLAAIPLRADPRDGLIAAAPYSKSIRAAGPEALPSGARVGTGSPRRAAQLRAFRSDIEILPIRGNLDTRILKLRDAVYDAIVVAVAGVERLGRAQELDWIFSPEECTPAVGQGSLVVQCRSDDRPMVDLAVRVNDAALMSEADAERAFLAAMGGGCELPVGALAHRDMGRLSVIGVVASPDGRRLVRRHAAAGVADPQQVGRGLAEMLLNEVEGLLMSAER
jgi:hydroxymethylbilane synthase